MTQQLYLIKHAKPQVNPAQLPELWPLSSEGIEAIVFDTQSAGYSDGAMVGVRVMVLDEDLPEAERLFSEYDA